MPDMREMNSQLIGSACYGFQFEQCFIVKSVLDPKVCDRLFSVRFDIPKSIFHIASDGRVNRSEIFIYQTFDNGEILFFDEFALKMTA